MSLHTLASTDLNDNAISTNGGGYFLSSPGARAVFDTTGRVMDVSVNGPGYSFLVDSSRIAIRVNGADFTSVNPQQTGPGTSRILLPRGPKRVEVISSSLTKPTTIFGTYLVSVNFVDDAASTLIAPSASNRLLVYGDSIAVGYSADVHMLRGWTARLRQVWPGSVLMDAWASRKFSDDSSTTTTRQNLVNFQAALNPSKIWLSIGTNDYGFNTQTAATFGTAYADYLDKLIATIPNSTVTIYCQSPIPAVTETANGGGDTLGNYRTQIQTAAAARPSRCVFVDGTTLVSLSKIFDSGKHPTTDGHKDYFNAVRVILGV